MNVTNTTDTDIMEKGMNYLLQNLGPIDTARFISEIKRENADYSKMLNGTTFEHATNSFSDDYLEDGRPEQSRSFPEVDLNP